MIDAPDPFFLLGADRSGTTLLRKMLVRDYLVAIPPESEFIRDLANWRAGPPPTPAEVRWLLTRLAKHPRFESWGVAPPRLAEDLELNDRLSVFREVMAAAFKSFAELTGAAVWGDKTPSYTQKHALLHEIWPECRIVFMERDGRDVYSSVRDLPFGPNTPAAAARAWVQAVESRRAAELMYPGRVMSVRYEDLTRNPTSTVATVANFLCLATRSESPATRSREGERVDDSRASWFPKLRDKVDTSSVCRWRADMSADEVAKYMAVAAAHLGDLGYPDASPGAWASTSAAETARQNGREIALRARNFVRLRLIEERGREISYVLRRKLGNP